jgi:hypothetical protein
MPISQKSEVQAEGGSKPSQLAIRDPGSAGAPPSSITVLSPQLLFLGSWLGHSNLVLYEFQNSQSSHANHGPAAPISSANVPATGTASNTPAPALQSTAGASVDGSTGQARARDVLEMDAAAEALGCNQGAVLAAASCFSIATWIVSFFSI